MSPIPHHVSQCFEATSIADDDDDDVVECPIRNTAGVDVDMTLWFNITTFDLAAQFLFGETFQGLQTAELHTWIRFFSDFHTVTVSLEVFGRWMGTDRLPHLLKRLPNGLREKLELYFEHTRAKMNARLERGTETTDWITPKNGVLKAIVQAGSKVGMTLEELHANAYVLILAGSELTATTLSAALYSLCIHADALEHLTTTAVRMAFLVASAITFSGIRDMPFLNACLKEALRIHLPTVHGLPRIAPPGGAYVDGLFVPEGTVVRTSIYGCAQNPASFASPDDCRPDWWLASLDSTDILDASSPFPRGCRRVTLWVRMRTRGIGGSLVVSVMACLGKHELDCRIGACMLPE